jgi:hypothetical protein
MRPRYPPMLWQTNCIRVPNFSANAAAKTRKRSADSLRLRRQSYTNLYSLRFCCLQSCECVRGPLRLGKDDTWATCAEPFPIRRKPSEPCFTPKSRPHTTGLCICPQWRRWPGRREEQDYPYPACLSIPMDACWLLMCVQCAPPTPIRKVHARADKWNQLDYLHAVRDV